MATDPSNQDAQVVAEQEQFDKVVGENSQTEDADGFGNPNETASPLARSSLLKRRRLLALNEGISLNRVVRLVVPVVLLIAWYVVTKFGIIGPEFLASPAALAQEFVNLVRDGYLGTPLWVQVWASLARTLVGFGIAVTIAIPLGLFIGLSPLARAAFSPILSFLRPIPAIAYIPLVILWLGIGEVAKVLVITIATLLLVVVNTSDAVASVSKGYRAVALNLGANQRQLFFKVILPASLPGIFTGLKIGLATAWLTVVAAELVAAQTGLGFMILDAATFYRMPVVYIGVILIGLLGLLMSIGLDFAEKKIVHWAGKE